MIPFVDTCYTKVQDYLGFDDKLIVVYIEDTSSLIAKKGYLLYNPRTGFKTNFEIICTNSIVSEEEDTIYIPCRCQLSSHGRLVLV